MSENQLLPSWAEDLRSRYLAGEASVFLLHGNVRDLFPWQTAPGEFEYLPLSMFLERFLGRSKEIVLNYNCSEGLRFADKKMSGAALRAVNTRRALDGERELDALPKNSDDVLGVIEDLIVSTDGGVAVVLDYVETLVPNADLSFMGEADKSNLVTLQRWTTDPVLQRTDNLVLMVTQHLSDLQRRLVSSAQLVPIEIQLPTVEERGAYISGLGRESNEASLGEDVLAEHTGGLSLVHIRGLCRQADQSGTAITFQTVSARKKAIIEQECSGLVEFVAPTHDFQHVGGMEGIKADLMGIAAAIKSGRRNQVPMGIIFVGPMGTGKTYVAEAFAGESGLTCIKFKNFREKWVGSTEANLEKVLQVVEALGYVLLIIDEADRSLSAGGESDGGTNSRVIARLKEFMSDTTHRGRVVILLMTNRPDKLDTDLKRPGRFDLKIPFFFPESPIEREAILRALIRKNKLDVPESMRLDELVSGTEGYSAAEIEAVLLAAAGLAGRDGRTSLSQADLTSAVQDVIPSRDTRMLAFMEMLAVFEASSRRMLPERYRNIDAEEVQKELDSLRILLGQRVR
ncbi:MAG: ATP-binding protein [Myxococcota bacterium]|nr:ATP-binding protein [Myxococcota bacterium]